MTQASRDITAIVLPPVLVQFFASYAAINMNVAINNMAAGLGITVIGVQSAISHFTLVMGREHSSRRLLLI
jgi:hypothetical protein